MGIKWKDFEMPKKLECDESTYTSTYGKFIAEPFESGYGVTIGNSLRRMLLSSIQGTAVTWVKFDGILHEYSTIPGVLEDVTEIIFNIKKLILRLSAKQPKIMLLNVNKKGEIKASDIQTDETIEIFNPDLHIATLTKKIRLKAEMEVSTGRGYLPVERQSQQEEWPIGVIPIDTVFSPVKKANFTIENTRVGQTTEYDKLILEIWTSGGISPKDALLYASIILQRHFDIFVNFGQLPEEEVKEEENKLEELKEKLNMPISELELSVRSTNCLKESGIKTIGELVTKAEKEMLAYRNFGKKSLAEIGEILKKMELSLEMELPGELDKAQNLWSDRREQA